jgi:hypothetical protein
MPCSLLKGNQHVGGTCLHFQDQRISQLRKQSSACFLLHSGFLLGLFFDPEDVPSKCLLTSNGLHGIITQEKGRDI